MVWINVAVHACIFVWLNSWKKIGYVYVVIENVQNTSPTVWHLSDGGQQFFVT